MSDPQKSRIGQPYIVFRLCQITFQALPNRSYLKKTGQYYRFRQQNLSDIPV